MKTTEKNLALLRKLILFLVFCCNLNVLQAQVVISNLNSISQDFNTLPSSGSGPWADNSTIPGWYAATDNNNVALSTITASDGNQTNFGLYSYGHSNAPSDRGLGCITQSGQGQQAITGNYYYGIRLKNNTGGIIRSFTVSHALEVWYDGKKTTANLNFHYSKGATVTSLTAGTWIAGSDASSSISVNGNRASVDGNASNCRILVNATVNNVDLAAGEEIMLRWTDTDDNNNFIAIDDVVITPSDVDLYYNKTTGGLHSLATWGAKSDGTGASPVAFTDNYQKFILKNTLAPTLTAAWAVSGTNSKVIVGDNAQAVNFTIPATFAFTGEIDVKDNAKLTINNTATPALGVLGTLSTVEYNTAPNQVLDAAEYGILSIGTASKKLGGNIKIKNALTFNNAKIDLDAYDLTLEDGATITGASATAFISTKGAGKLKMNVKNNNTDVLFPVGTDVYLPVKIKQGPGATSDVFSVKAIDGIYGAYANNVPTGVPYGNKSVNQTWIIDEALVGGSNITLTLEWASANTLVNFDPANSRLVHYTNGAWDDATPVNASLVNGRYSVSRSNIQSFSPFGVFGGEPLPLPVELISFQAARNESGVVCNWATASEKNNSHFVVERSLTGREFVEIGEIKGNGTTTEQNNYSFTDTGSLSETAYYRLRQVDFDGAMAYSEIVKVGPANPVRNSVVSLYPNPANALRTLKVNAPVSGTVQIVVRNVQGQLVKNKQTDGAKLQQGVDLDLQGQPAGVYFIEVKTQNNSSVLRAVQL